MSSKIIAAALCLLAGAAQAQTVTLTSEEVSDAVKAAVEASASAAVAKPETKVETKADAKVAEAPAKKALDAVKAAPPAIVSGSLTVTPTIDVPAAVSASLPAAVSTTAEAAPASTATSVDANVGVTTLDEAFAAISGSTAYDAQPETTTMEGQGEKLEDYMKDAARPASEPADGGVIPMSSDGDDMMGY